MSLRRLRVLLHVTSAALLLMCVVTSAQRQRPAVRVGTPTCEPYFEENNLPCRDLRCRHSGPISSS